MKRIVKRLRELNKTISTMESCTGGALVNAITSVEGASDILKFSAVTYSNEFKIKMGVSSDIINKYSVYSKETAMEMSKNISCFTNSDYSIGITGKLNRIDKNNLYGDDNLVYICIYEKSTKKFNNYSLKVDKKTRADNKRMILSFITKKMMEILK